MYCPNLECPDYVEDGRPGEYVDTVTVCPKCGATLIAEMPGRPRPRMRDAAWDAAIDGDGSLPVPPPPPAGLLVAVAAFDYPDEADALVRVLSDRGIAAYQFFDDGRDFEEESAVAPCTRVLVAESQAESAATLAARHRNED